MTFNFNMSDRKWSHRKRKFDEIKIILNRINLSFKEIIGC